MASLSPCVPLASTLPIDTTFAPPSFSTISTANSHFMYHSDCHPCSLQTSSPACPPLRASTSVDVIANAPVHAAPSDARASPTTSATTTPSSLPRSTRPSLTTIAPARPSSRPTTGCPSVTALLASTSDQQPPPAREHRPFAPPAVPAPPHDATVAASDAIAPSAPAYTLHPEHLPAATTGLLIVKPLTRAPRSRRLPPPDAFLHRRLPPSPPVQADASLHQGEHCASLCASDSKLPPRLHPRASEHVHLRTYSPSARSSPSLYFFFSRSLLSLPASSSLRSPLCFSLSLIPPLSFSLYFCYATPSL